MPRNGTTWRAQKNAMIVPNYFGVVLYDIGDPYELGDTFKCETLEAAKGSIGEYLRSQSGFVSLETLDSIEESRSARFAGNHDQYRAL